MNEETRNREGEQVIKWHWWWITIIKDDKYITQDVATEFNRFDVSCIEYLRKKLEIDEGKFIILNLAYAGQATKEEFNNYEKS